MLVKHLNKNILKLLYLNTLYKMFKYVFLKRFFNKYYFFSKVQDTLVLPIMSSIFLKTFIGTLNLVQKFHSIYLKTNRYRYRYSI